MQVHATVYSLDNRTLLTRDYPLDLPADSAAPLPALPLRQFFAAEGVVLVRLTLKDAARNTVSENTYWLAATDADYRALGTLPAVALKASATRRPAGPETASPQTASPETVIDLTLTNPTTTPALQAKATLLDSSTGQRILPAYFSDNYVTLLPGETTRLSIRVPPGRSTAHPRIALRGFNVVSEDAAFAP